MEIRKKILLVDDEPETLGFMASTLGRHDYEVISASCGERAIELAKQLKPDLIILDVIMPDMDGGDVAAALKSEQATQNIPIIFLTGILAKDEETSRRTTGSRHVLAKPVSSAELLSAVEKVFPG